MAWWMWIVAIVAGLFALDRLFLWMEARGWIYWRKVKRKVSAGDSMLEIAALMDLGARHAVEARKTVHAEEDDGDDDDKRKPDDQVR